MSDNDVVELKTNVHNAELIFLGRVEGEIKIKKQCLLS